MINEKYSRTHGGVWLAADLLSSSAKPLQSPLSLSQTLILFCICSYHIQRSTRNTLLAVTDLQWLKLSGQTIKQNALLSMLFCMESYLTFKLNTQLEKYVQAMQMYFLRYRFGYSGWKVRLWHPLVFEQRIHFLHIQFSSYSMIYSFFFNSKSKNYWNILNPNFHALPQTTTGDRTIPAEQDSPALLITMGRTRGCWDFSTLLSHSCLTSSSDFWNFPI